MQVGIGRGTANDGGYSASGGSVLGKIALEEMSRSFICTAVDAIAAS